MNTNQKGHAPIIIVLILIILAIIGGSYYLSTLVKKDNLQVIPTPLAALTPIPSIYKNVQTTATYQPIPQSKLPSDIPLFTGSQIAYTTRMKSCGYQESNKFCEVNSFIYQIPKPGLQVEEVLNWYITNPNPSWVYGTPKFIEANSGKIVNGDTYFIIRIAGLKGTENGVQLTFEGPYEQK